MISTQMGIKKLKKLEIKKIKDLKIGIGIEKKQRNKAEDNVTNTFNHIFVLYPEYTSTDLLTHAYYRDPYFDFMAPLADETRLKQILCCRAQS